MMVDANVVEHTDNYFKNYKAVTGCASLIISQNLSQCPSSFVSLHTYVSFLSCKPSTKQYNLVPAKEVISLAGEVTAGLVESNGSLPPGL